MVCGRSPLVFHLFSVSTFHNDTGPKKLNLIASSANFKHTISVHYFEKGLLINY